MIQKDREKPENKIHRAHNRAPQNKIRKVPNDPKGPRDTDVQRKPPVSKNYISHASEQRSHHSTIELFTWTPLPRRMQNPNEVFHPKGADDDLLA